jgi:hypothetical protein
VCVFHAFSLSLTLSLSISLPPPLFLSPPPPPPPLSHSLSSLTFVRARILLIALTNRISPWESLYSDRRVNAYYSKGISSRTHSLRCVSKFLTVTYLRYASKSLTRALVDEILLLLFNSSFSTSCHASKCLHQLRLSLTRIFALRLPCTRMHLGAHTHIDTPTDTTYTHSFPHANTHTHTHTHTHTTTYSQNR